MAGESREFGAYRLLRRLGVGGMAETFEAARAGTGGFEQRVCLKRILPAYSDDPEFVSRFRREAQVAANLRHSNIVGVTDFGEVEGVTYMALELVDGVDLRSLLRSLRGQRLRPEVVALIGLDLARALEHAHHRIVHRDVSAANVLISRTGEAKLADFGIAKALEADDVTASKNVPGKIPYMSPEQMRGGAVDARSDLFSLGVVLFEAVAGVRPFDGAHEVETMHRISAGQRRRLLEVAPDTPPALATVIEAAIASDPAKRPATAGQLADALATLSPPPKVRRELAALIEAQRGGPRTRMHVRARDEEPDTELSRVPALPELVPTSPGAVPRTPGRTARTRTAVVVLLALTIAVGVFALVESSWWRAADDAQAPAARTSSGTTALDPGRAPGETAPAVSPLGAAEPAEGALTPIGASRTTSDGPLVSDGAAIDTGRAGHGWLRVVVQPWGNVWIDGMWMGRAPVEARLVKGRHLVQAGHEVPSKKKVIEIVPGERNEVEVYLVE